MHFFQESVNQSRCMSILGSGRLRMRYLFLQLPNHSVSADGLNRLVVANRRGQNIPYIAFFGLLALTSLSSLLHAQEQPVSNNRAYDQFIAGEGACFPTCILNSLLYGDDRFAIVLDSIPGKSNKEKLRYIIENQGGEKSLGNPQRKVFEKASGVMIRDNAPFFNAVLALNSNERVSGMLANRNPNESARDHLIRIHQTLKRSLSAGVPPIVSLRAIAARRSNNGTFDSWKAVRAHAIVINKIPNELKINQDGFSFGYIEPAGGVEKEGYLFPEQFRDFSAQNSIDAIELHNMPFLNTLMPSLNLQENNIDWYVRGIIVVDFITGMLE